MSRIRTIIRALWATEPARVVSWVVAAAAVAGLRVADADILAVLVVALPIPSVSLHFDGAMCSVPVNSVS